MLKTLKSKLYFIAAAGFIFILIVNLFLIYFSNGLKNEMINSGVISGTSTGIKTFKGNLLQIIFLSRIKMLKMNAVKSKKAKARIEKSYDAKILKLVAASKPIYRNVSNALTGYTVGFAKVKSAVVFGEPKSKLNEFSSQKTALLLKSLKNKFYIFRPIVGRLLKYPLLLGGAMSTKYFDSQLDPMVSQISQISVIVNKSYYKKVKLLDYIFIAFPIVFLIGALIVILYFKNSVIKVLNLVDEKIKQIAKGDLTSKIKISGVHKESEIGILIEQVNSLVDSLSGNVKGIVNTSNSLSSQSEQLNSSSREFEKTIEQMREKASRIIESIKQMSIAIIEVAKNSSSSAQKAQETEKVVDYGTKSVQDVAREMKNIEKTVSAVSATITELGSSSEKIGEIIGVINDIADQTNLLALNAAIEAARAGEQGRGFAVVADEVRKLAERTTKATKEIEAMILSIQRNTQDAVTSMQKGKEEVSKGAEIAGKSAEAISNINSLMLKLKEMITQIATASEEQSQVSEEISLSSEEIIKAQDNAQAGSRQVIASSEELGRMALDLSNMVRMFKTA
ncbi:MAG: methyl-accepting chemotaxis protein [Candidatus Acidulodesulfobacterium acidiphilum]|uniref:Methyl-accepting chemotaxis protein n=1 Tax=Candidatus Acidulodesulfobacterium acidiphilum TaxID=2597224 RepID=A0A520X931_9DELT|nr:MAG: methyl-accepting chemotaxis protein [Candidatus Acidulodesulfobacterium acidiphilum]